MTDNSSQDKRCNLTCAKKITLGLVAVLAVAGAARAMGLPIWHISVALAAGFAAGYALSGRLRRTDTSSRSLEDLPPIDPTKSITRLKRRKAPVSDLTSSLFRT
jgi:hypothetical protein